MQIGYQDTPGHQGYRWCLQCQGGRWKLVSQRWKVRNMWLFLGWKSYSCSYCGCFFCSPGAYFLVQAMNHICSEQNIAPEFWKYVLHRRYVLVGEPTFWVPTSQQLCWLCKGILPKMILIYVGELLCLQIFKYELYMIPPSVGDEFCPKILSVARLHGNFSTGYGQHIIAHCMCIPLWYTLIYFDMYLLINIHTPPYTIIYPPWNSSHMKMHGWNTSTSFLLGFCFRYFHVLKLWVSGRVSFACGSVARWAVIKTPVWLVYFGDEIIIPSYIAIIVSITRWWFQIFFMFTPIWGRFPFWLIFFRWVETTN